MGKKQMGKEDAEIREFARCHPMPSPGDELSDRLKNSEVANGMIFIFICKIDIMQKKIYMKTSVIKR